MLTRLTPLAALLITLIVAPFTSRALAQGEAVALRARLTPGAEMTYTIQQRMLIDQRQTIKSPDAEQPPVTTAVSESFAQAARLKFKVDSVAADGAAVVNARVVDLVLYARTASQTAKYVAGPGAGSLELAGDDGVRNTTEDEGLSSVGKALMNAEIRISVDAAGEVTEIAGLETMLEALAAQESFTIGGGENVVPDSRIAGIFGAENVGDVLGRLFHVDGAATTARTSGGAWQTERVIPVPPVGALGILHNWSFDSHEDGQAKVSGSMTMEVRRPDEVPETAATVELGEHEGKTVIVWDTKAGQLVRRTTRQDVGSVWKLGDTLQVTQNQNFMLDLIRD